MKNLLGEFTNVDKKFEDVGGALCYAGFGQTFKADIEAFAFVGEQASKLLRTLLWLARG